MKYLKFIEKYRIPDYFRSKHTSTGEVVFDKDKCKACNICVTICPARALDLVKDESAIKNKIPFMEEAFKDSSIKLCLACGDCMAACPEGAITIKKGYNSSLYFKKISQKKEFSYPKKY